MPSRKKLDKCHTNGEYQATYDTNPKWQKTIDKAESLLSQTYPEDWSILSRAAKGDIECLQTVKGHFGAQQYIMNSPVCHSEGSTPSKLSVNPRDTLFRAVCEGAVLSASRSQSLKEKQGAKDMVADSMKSEAGGKWAEGVRCRLKLQSAAIKGDPEWQTAFDEAIAKGHVDPKEWEKSSALHTMTGRSASGGTQQTDASREPAYDRDSHRWYVPSDGTSPDFWVLSYPAEAEQ